jgi:hypothetical protein
MKHSFPRPNKRLKRNDEVRAENVLSKLRSKRKKAIEGFKKSYSEVGKVKTGEYDREKREFYYDKKSKKVSLLPSDDADRPIEKGIKKRNLGKNFK